jgi:transposase
VFLRRQDIRDTGQVTWKPAHLRGCSEVVCPTPMQPIVLQACVRAINVHTARLGRLGPALHAQSKSWRVSPVVDGLQALRGVQFPVVVTTGAELGDLTRVKNPRPRMQCVGLIASAYASGARRRQETLTQAGRTQARRAEECLQHVIARSGQASYPRVLHHEMSKSV